MEHAQTITTTYDTIYHAYALTQTNDLGHTSSYIYDYNLGLPTSLTGPNGANTTVTVSYDNFGRPVDIVRPGDSAQYPTMQVSYHDSLAPYWIELRQRIEEGQYATFRRYYDGLGQMIQAQTPGTVLGSGVYTVTVDTWYNDYGQVVQQSVPYTETLQAGFQPRNASRASSHTAYDVLGRTATQTAPDGTFASFAYSDLETRLTDPGGNATRTLYDAWGRTAQVIPLNGTNVNSPLNPQIAYSYDPLDRLAQVVNSGLYTTTLAYDYAGRKMQMSDPDMGMRQYAYDAVGNLVRQTDARGQRICLYYDELNRLRGKHYRTDDLCPGTPAYDVEYQYDQGTYGIGQRTWMDDSAGTVSWSYDARGQLVQEIREVIVDSIDYGDFKTAWGYNSAGLLASMAYPAGNNGLIGESVGYSYHPQMALDSVLGNFPYAYVDSTGYDEAGRVVRRTSGVNQNVVVSQYAYYDWDEQGGRLQQILAGVPGDPDSLQDLRYDYDLVGNVLHIYDYTNGAPQTQSFTYDALYRLTGAKAENGASGNYDQSLASSLGYTYNAANGNLASKAGTLYTYGDVNHRHAVTALSNGNTYSYDANGNMTQRVVGGQTYNLGYDPENRMVSVSGAAAAAYTYTGDGQRIVATEGVTTTVYLGK